ncbi:MULTISPECIES: ABC transporter permease [Bacillaceae]|jgi:putative ABC transport system permease protein|uniref:ABC transporter permease n=1 Tax=Cytobacillus firmus TaxID=1399 RepID=A0AA46P4G6_CYTFI|nr:MULTISPECIES: ABC transporter permease [Bacillaceae]KML41721.1 ABC transporter permease [Cytobacillus firmus]MCC3649128.1 ABC transporter permease [Cytobacillus oceanisediminis]MCS0655470.1 ABC transporter permease [Cytobacillus firmus]MCU1807865.1 ABC transporter permease [Cytobacillus firmus]UYG97367.1 ABC transporter permease [Cytobacillus firmus]
MTFRQFAFNNVIRNKRLYAAYFLSSLFTVMVFFTFSIFANHPALSGDAMNSTVTKGMNAAAGIIYVFSFFFVLYSMSSFLQSRKREFGLLMIQGMSMKQIRLMVFLENMLIGLFATVGGILLGLVFAKGILLLAENVLIIERTLSFYFPVKAILVTFISFIILFFFISLFVTYVLRSKKLIELIKGNKMSKGEPKANLFLTLLAVLLLGAGYAAALLAKGVMVVAAMVPVIIVVSIGTYLLFTQLSVFIIRRLKKNERVFWFKTNMLLFSDLAFRMKDNARTFFMVAMVSTVAFSAIGTLFGFQTVLTSSIKDLNATTFSYKTSEDQEEKNVAAINRILKEENIETESAHTVLQSFEVGGSSTQIASQSDFNRFASLIGEDPVTLKEGQVVVVEFEGTNFGQSKDLMNETITLTSGTVLKPKEAIHSKALPAIDSYFIMSDIDFKKLPEPTWKESYYAWQATNGEERVMAASEKLYKELPRYEITSVEYELYEIMKGYGPILFVGLFIGIVFFVSAGSFLYFRLYMDLDEDKQKFRSISKMGLTGKELKKVLNRQTMILFFAPILVALIHGAVALTALSNLFYFNLFKESVAVLSVFLAIQVVYFFIVRFFYTKQIQAAV